MKKITLFKTTIEKMSKKENTKKLEEQEDYVEGKKVKNQNFKMKDHELTKLLKHTLTGEMYHALLNLIVSPHLILKVFLFIFLAISYGLASYTIITLILTYFDYGVTTTVRTIYETPATFPKITICNVNQFTTQYAFELIQNISQENKIDVLDNKIFKNLDRYYKFLNANQFSNIAFGTINLMKDSDKQKLGHSLKDSLLSCTFNYKNCISDDFSWEFDPNYGNCYSFNSGFNSTGQHTELKQSNIAGNGYGLSLEIYTNYYENLSYFNSISKGQGLLIRIDNVSHLIDHALDGILVSAGMTTNIELSRVFKSTLPKPYSNCDFDSVETASFSSDLFNLIQKSPIEYTQQFCLNECLQKLIFKECNCVISFFKSVINASICTAENFSCALNTYLGKFIVNDYVKNSCLPLCPLECSSTSILYTLSSANLIGDSFVDDLKENSNLSIDFVTQDITPEIARQSVARLNVFYDSLSYTISDESPQLDFVTLMANIGGYSGLLLGMSLYSLCELVTALIEVYYFFKRSKN